MRPALSALLTASALAAALPLLLSGLAGAGAVDPPVHEIVIGGDTVVGTLTAPGQVRRIPFRVVEGTVLDASLTAARGGSLHPRLVLLGTDMQEDPAATAAMEDSPKGDGVALTGYRIPQTGRRWFEVRSADGSLGAFTLACRCRLVRKASGSGEVTGGGDPAEFEFVVPGDSTGSIAVKAAKGGAAAPSFAGLVGPDGQTVVVLDVRPAIGGFSLRTVPFALPGTYVLRVASPEGADGGFTVKAAWKTLKPVRRTLDASRIIADPVLAAVEPDHGDPGETLAITLAVRFAVPGAEVRFVRSPFVLTIPAGEVSVSAEAASFTLDLSRLGKGLYDIEIENPDEGVGRLPKSFAVGSSPPQPGYVSPSFGYDNEVVTARVTGSILVSQTTVGLRRGEDFIPGEDAVIASGSITADFDLRGRAPGAWDVVLESPGAEPSSLPGAFQIRAAPVLLSMEPSDNLDGPVVAATIHGAGFEKGTQVHLSLGDSASDPKVPGAGVVVAASDEIRATFDTTAAPLGTWALVIEYTGGRTARLEHAFHTVGRPGPAAAVLTLSPPGEAPAAVVYNATRNEYLLGYVVINPRAWMITWTLLVQRTDAAGKPLSTPVAVSTGSVNYPKGDVALAWDPDRDEYLVAWSEYFRVTPTQNGQPHPNGTDPTLLAQVMAQRLKGLDLSAVGANRRVSDHTVFPASAAVQWYVEDFENFRPSVVYDRGRRVYEIAWMQAFDTTGLYSSDDYNVFTRSLDPAADALGALVEVGTTPYHEGDPCLAWDEAGARVLLAYNARPGSDKAGLDVLLGTGGKHGVVATGGTDDLADPVAVPDAGGGRVLVTYTRIATDGTRSARGLVADGQNLAVVLGTEQTLAEGTSESFHVRPVFAAHIHRFLLTWTEWSPSAMAVRQRYADAPGTKGLVLVGHEEETSGGSGDEALGAVAYGPEEEAVFHFRTMSTSTRFVEYPGDEFAGGSYAGAAIMLQRLK